MTVEQAYQQFKAQNELPIYLESWYLDVACSSGECKMVYYEEEGLVLGLYFYFIKQKWTVNYITVPTLVKYMGPVFAGHVQASEEPRILHKLLEQVERAASNTQQWMPSLTRLVVDLKGNHEYLLRDTFHWKFKSNEDMLQAMDGNYRRSIQKYAHFMQSMDGVSKKAEQDAFIELLEKNMGPLKAHGIHKMQLIQFIDALEKRKSGKLICLYKEAELIGASLISWDTSSAYYLFAANNKAYNKYYPGVQTAWKSVEYLKKHTKVEQLDFLGSSIPSIAKVWTKLGAQKKQYALLSQKSSALFSALNKIRRFLNKNG